MPPVRDRVRSNPWLAIAVVVGVLLVAAWIAWAIYVASDRGAREGLGVLIAWPALIVAAGLIALPFIGVFFLIRRRDVEGDSGATKPSNTPADDSSKDTGETEEAEATSSG